MGKATPTGKHLNKILFQAVNNHVDDCGNPPRFTTRDRAARYHGYFENHYGEQFVFVYDFDKEIGTVYGGDLDDLDWADGVEIVELTPAAAARQLVEAVNEFRGDQRQPLTLAEAEKYYAGDHTSITCRRLRNGNLLYPYGCTLSPEEMRWVSACWEAAIYRRSPRTDRRAASGTKTDTEAKPND